MIKKYNFTYAVLLLVFLMFQSCAEHTPKLHIISNTFEENTPSAHGLQKVIASLDTLGVTINQDLKANEEATDYYMLLGKSSEENEATQLLQELKLSLPNEKEGLQIKKTTYKGKPALVLCGADDVGLMYAALDVAKRMSWSKDSDDLFEHIKDVSEAPDVKERAVSAGSFNRAYFEQKLHDKQYWVKYFDMMAESRLNQFLLIFGYKNVQYKEPNFMAPAYPNFFNVDEFPLVKMKNVTKEQQEKNTKALKEVIALAHSRGIEFGVGLWDQIDRDKRFRKIVKNDAEMPANLRDNIIWGLTHENLIPYTKVAIRKFLQTFPEIDLVQFRMHWESGISGDVALKFWKETFNILKEENPKLKVEARAKDVPDETLYDGVDTGMDFRVATKHWMEQMGMPFHPTHVNVDDQLNRRHGYADMLRYPKRYGFKWRVWTGGTTRLFLWGDPEWVKLFVESSHLYDAKGFEFNEPLYFKMNGSKHDAEVSELLNPEYKYYTYEFERYWHYYQVMGRVTYNPNTPTDTWEKEFTNKFDEEAGLLLMDGLHQASKVLPRIVTASYLYPRFASPQGWPELQRMEDLKHYAKNAIPSDIQQFTSPMEEAEQILNSDFTIKRNASKISDWFSKTSDSILINVKKAEEIVGENPSKEFISTITDLKMLVYLAKYHSQRLLAAVQYNLYSKTGDLVSFDKAIEFESHAVNAYGNIVKSAADVYNMQLDFGSVIALFPGHWDKEHQRLVGELQALKEEKAKLVNQGKFSSTFTHVPVQKAKVGSPIDIKATLPTGKNIKSAHLMYTKTNTNDFDNVALNISKQGMGSATIPSTGKEDVLKYYLKVSYESGSVEYLPKNAPSKPYSVIITNDEEPPNVEVERILHAPLNKELKISAKVEDASEIGKVILRYRRVSQFEDYQSVSMIYNDTLGVYEASIPASYFDGKYDVMYFIEAMDTKGNGSMYPDMEKETPYVIVQLNR